MEFHCRTHYPPKPLDPAVDPAYHDGIPPRPRQVKPAGEIAVDWPVVRIPPGLDRLHTISIEALEDELERAAAREEFA
jgi:hypothetical protein